MPIADAPTRELGAPGITGSYGWLDTWETTPEVKWPASVLVYDRMRKDGHIAASLRAITLPIRRTRWRLAEDPDVRPEVMEFVRTNLGLDQSEGRRRRRRQGIVWGDFLRHALLELVFGHMYFEPVYMLADGRAHLRKLGPRMPRTISGFEVAADGGLNAIKQHVPRPNGMWDEVTIPMDRLVAFVHDQEGSDWSGTSILRPAYPHWLIKQHLLKIDAMAGERNGMGIPVVTYNPERMTKTEALSIATKLRAGEEAGAAFEEGAAKLEILGVEGNVRDILESIRYHDQEAGREMLTMFLDLGHDNGARSLGDTFVDFFVMANQSEVDHVADIATEHVVRDLVEINWGPDEAYPQVITDPIEDNPAALIESLTAAVSAKLVTADAPIEDIVRDRLGLPKRVADRPVPAVDPASVTDGTLAELEARLAHFKAREVARSAIIGS